MASSPMQALENGGQPLEGESGQFIRVIVADTQAIFRAGLRKIFAVEDDVRVVGQAETLISSLSFSPDFSYRAPNLNVCDPLTHVKLSEAL